MTFGKRIGRTAVLSFTFGIICFLTTGLSSLAQHPERLPDSLNTSTEVLSSELKETETVSSGTDSVGQTTEKAEAAGEADPKVKDGTSPALDPEQPVLRTIPDSVIDRYRKDKAFAYANDLSYWVKEKDPVNNNGWLIFLERLLTSVWFRYLIYSLLGSILLFAIYKIVKENNLQLFFRNPPKAISDGAEETELTVEDLEEKLEQAIKSGNYRLGVRYLFLKTLGLLDSRGMIHFHARTTNHDYLRQMKGNTQEPDFRYLIRAYEHVWYGDFSLNSEQFDRVNHYFQKFYKSIGTTP
ncbi:DUF4129 domain-containing protein [Flavitalea flava]